MEHFAFRGIPNVNSPRLPDENVDKNDQNSLENELEEDRSITVNSSYFFALHQLKSMPMQHTLMSRELVLIGACNNELLSLLILYRALWNESSMKSEKGVTLIDSCA